jgi:hypothetical protein
VAISTWIRAHGAGKTTYMVGGAPGFYIKHGTIRFLAYGFQTEDITDLDAFLHTQHFDPASSVFIVMPAGHDLIPKLVAAVGPLTVGTHRNIHNQIDFYTGVPQQTDGGRSPNDPV